MSFKQFLAAASDWRPLAVAGAGIVAAAVLSNPFPAVIGFGIYLWAAQRLASSPSFQQAADQVKTARSLEQRYREMEARTRELDQRLLASLPATLDRPWQARVQDVANAARSVYQEWQKQPQEQADKAPFVDEALQLAALYMRMLRAFHAICAGQHPADLKAVQERLARNKWRLEATQDLEARQTLLQAIEMDERVLQQEMDEVADKERYVAKLSAIESTMDLLRRQVFEPASGNEGQRVHELLVEAAAMDQAMEEVQHRSRVRAR